MDHSNFHLMPMIPLIKRGVLNRLHHLATAPVIWEVENGINIQNPKIEYEIYIEWLKSQLDKSVPLFMIDVGQGKTGPDYSMIKESHIRGWQRWFDPGIRSIDDIFDAFSMDIDMLFIRSSCLNSLELLKEAQEISDSCIPLLMCYGNSVIFNNGTRDLDETLKEIDSVDFENIMVLDLLSLGKKNKPGNPFWRDIYRGSANLIPAGGITEKDLPYLREWNFKEAVRDYVSPPLQTLKENPLPEYSPSETTHEYRRSIARPALDFCNL